MTEPLKQHLNKLLPINQSEWLMLKKHLKFCEYKKGDYFAEINKSSNSIGFIVSGAFRTFCIDNAGVEITYLLNFENDFLASFESFLTAQKSKFSIQALEDSKIILLKKEALLHLYETSKYWEKFGRMIAENMYQKTQNLYQDLLLETAEYRYLKLLEKYPEIFNRVPLYYIASLIGIRPQSLTRLRKNLKNKKVKLT